MMIGFWYLKIKKKNSNYDLNIKINVNSPDILNLSVILISKHESTPLIPIRT